MDEFIKNFVTMLLENDLMLEYDYEYGWLICSDNPYKTINLSDVAYKLNIGTKDSDDVIKQKMSDFCTLSVIENS